MDPNTPVASGSGGAKKIKKPPKAKTPGGRGGRGGRGGKGGAAGADKKVPFPFLACSPHEHPHPLCFSVSRTVMINDRARVPSILSLQGKGPAAEDVEDEAKAKEDQKKRKRGLLTKDCECSMKFHLTFSRSLFARTPMDTTLILSHASKLTSLDFMSFSHCIVSQ